LSLFIVLKPFGTPISPNLSSLLNWKWKKY
jgi:hypothetical protein